MTTGEQGPALLYHLSQVIEIAVHGPDIVIESFPSVFRESYDRQGSFVPEFLLCFDVTGHLQLLQMRREVALRHACLVFQESEIGFFNRIEVDENQQSSRFMDGAVDIFKHGPLISLLRMLIHRVHPEKPVEVQGSGCNDDPSGSEGGDRDSELPEYTLMIEILTRNIDTQHKDTI